MNALMQPISWGSVRAGRGSWGGRCWHVACHVRVGRVPSHPMWRLKGPDNQPLSDCHTPINDLVRPTCSNCEALRRLKQSGVEAFEVTAPINRMLGLLGLPQHSHVNCLTEL